VIAYFGENLSKQMAHSLIYSLSSLVSFWCFSE